MSEEPAQTQTRCPTCHQPMSTWHIHRAVRPILLSPHDCADTGTQTVAPGVDGVALPRIPPAQRYPDSDDRLSHLDAAIIAMGYVTAHLQRRPDPPSSPVATVDAEPVGSSGEHTNRTEKGTQTERDYQSFQDDSNDHGVFDMAQVRTALEENGLAFVHDWELSSFVSSASATSAIPRSPDHVIVVFNRTKQD